MAAKAHAVVVHPATVQRVATSVTTVTSEYQTDARVVSKNKVADDVVELVLIDDQGRELPAWQPGAHVDLMLSDVAPRQYSLCGEPSELGSYRLGILRDPNSRGTSAYVHDTLSVGDVVGIRGPRNNFPLISVSKYVFIAGGIGVTPILPMVAAVNAAGASWALAYGGRRRASMAFLGELADYRERVSIWPEDELGLLELDRILDGVDDQTAIYCCGPEPLLRAVEERCHGPVSELLHIERFSPRQVDTPQVDEQFEVYLAQSDVTLAVPADRTLMSVLQDSGIDLLYSCQEGTCGTCEVAVLEGEPDHRDSILTEDERASNACMMVCVSRSRTPRLVLDL